MELCDVKKQKYFLRNSRVTTQFKDYLIVYLAWTQSILIFPWWWNRFVFAYIQYNRCALYTVGMGGYVPLTEPCFPSCSSCSTGTTVSRPSPRPWPVPPQEWTPHPMAPAPPSTSWRNYSWLLHRTWKNWTSTNTMRSSVNWAKAHMEKWIWSSTKSEVITIVDYLSRYWLLYSRLII